MRCNGGMSHFSSTLPVRPDADSPVTGDEAPLVSVIIPARNAQATLDQTLWSVRSQSYGRWELIVVNDGSTDHTSEIVQAHSHDDARIREVRGASQGVSAARNLGVAHSRGQILAFLDADDLWLPGKLWAHVGALQAKPGVGLGFDRIRFVSADAVPTPVVSTRRVRNLDAADLLSENPACTASTLVMRRAAFEAVGGFDPQLRHAEDLELMIRVRTTTAWAVDGLDQVLTHYRASAAGASSDLDKMQAGWEAVMHKVKGYAPLLWHSHGPQATAIHRRYLARRALRLSLPASVGLHWWRLAWQACPSALLRQPFRSLGTLAGLLWQLASTQLRSRTIHLRSLP